MILRFLDNCFLQWFLIKIVAAQMPGPKYIQMSNMAPIRPNVPTMPSVPMAYHSNPTISSLLNNYLPNLPSYSNLPFSNIPNAPPNYTPHMMPMAPQMNLPVPNLPLPITNIPKMSPVMPMAPQMNSLACPLSTPKLSASSYLDPTVMNNLAVALHLLILNNLLHPPEHETQKQPSQENNPPPTPPVYPQNPQPPQTVPQPQQNLPGYYPDPQEPPQPFSPPSSKFLCSSGFADPLPSLIAPMPSYGHNQSPRSAHNLQSPYEALGPGPQGNDVFSQYGPQNLKADFQSPYNSIMASNNATKDLFTMF